MLFGFLAAHTDLELVTGVLILPQRQAVLVAKQAAEVDLFTGGKFRLGVGIGWNEVEYQALGMDFRNRARRYEEQIEVMRLLWTHDVVTFKGRYHEIDAAGILPRPVQRPIPIWMGGGATPAVLERIGRLGRRLDRQRGTERQSRRARCHDPRGGRTRRARPRGHRRPGHRGVAAGRRR